MARRLGNVSTFWVIPEFMTNVIFFIDNRADLVRKDQQGLILLVDAAQHFLVETKLVWIYVLIGIKLIIL